METVFPYYWFDTTGNPDTVDKVREHESETGRGQKIRCRSCEYIVTDHTQRIAIENNHSHYRINPSGVEFHFQCFSSAPGCGIIGPATSEHTWFAGYHWQIAICQGCGEHLGWYFRGESSFFGLITIRLIDETN